MTCVRCQTIDAATASGNEEQLIRELYRQIDRLLDAPPPERVDVVPRLEHERIVARLNERIAALNEQIDRRKAS